MSLKILLRDTEIFPPYLVRKPGVSEEEYFQITDEGSLCELFDGELIMHPPSSRKHEKLFIFLASLFCIYAEKKELGTFLGSRFAMRLRRDLIFEPGPWNPVKLGISYGQHFMPFFFSEPINKAGQ